MATIAPHLGAATAAQLGRDIQRWVLALCWASEPAVGATKQVAATQLKLCREAAAPEHRCPVSRGAERAIALHCQAGSPRRRRLVARDSEVAACSSASQRQAGIAQAEKCFVVRLDTPVRGIGDTVAVTYCHR